MNAAVVMRFVFLFIGFLSGFYGLGAAVLASIVVMCRKKSFGVPFMTPIYPLNKAGLADTLLILPKKVLGRRELDR
jgi:spore germination protein KA